MKPYLIRAQVRGFKPEFVDYIVTRVIDEWHFRLHFAQSEPPYLEFAPQGGFALGDGLMALGEAPFVDRIAQVVWEANDGACEVLLQLYDLKDAPFTAAQRGCEAHDQWRAAQHWQVGQAVDVNIDEVLFLCRLARIVSDGVYVKAGDEPVPDWLLRRKLSPMRGEVVLATRMLMANLDGEVQHG